MNLMTMGQNNDSSSFYLKINELSIADYLDRTITIIDNQLIYRHTKENYLDNGETNRTFEIKLNNINYLKHSILELLSSHMDTIRFEEPIGDHQLPEYEIILKYQNLNFTYSFWGGSGIILQLYFAMKLINNHLPIQDKLKYVTFIDEQK